MVTKRKEAELRGSSPVYCTILSFFVISLNYLNWNLIIIIINRKTKGQIRNKNEFIYRREGQKKNTRAHQNYKSNKTVNENDEN